MSIKRIWMDGDTMRVDEISPEDFYRQPKEESMTDRATLDEIASMMSEFVDNWPQPKKISTALALIAKTIRAALDPPQHDYWRPGESDCPRDLLAGNGELRTLRCKICGLDDLHSNSVCRAALRATLDPTGEKT